MTIADAPSRSASLTDAAAGPATTIAELLTRSAQSNHGIVLIDRELAPRPLSYRELLERGSLAAGALTSAGVRPGDRVCLLSPTTAELLVGLAGVWLAGAVPVLLSLPGARLDLGDYVEEVGRRARHVRARMVLVADLLLPFVPPAGMGTAVLPIDGLDSAAGVPAEPAAVDADDPAFLQFTSGSTGLSRSVVLSHRQMLSNVAAIGAAFGLNSDDCYVSWLPLFHDMGLNLVLSAIAHRSTLILEPTEEFLARPDSWLGALSHYRGTVTVAPNFAYGLAARGLRARSGRPLDLSTVRVAGNGAEPVDGQTLDEFVALAAPHGFHAEAICPMYGLAEATLGVSMSRADEPMRDIWAARSALAPGADVERVSPDDYDSRRIISCGRPLPGVEVTIIREADSPLGEGRVGEICLRSPGVMSGYWEEQESTAAVIRSGLLHTGDLGFLDHGELFVCGRIKDMIIVGGRNLYPEDYEQECSRVPGIRRGNVIAFGLEHEERMVVIAETADAEHAGRISIDAMNQLRRRLPQAPEEVVLVSKGSLPKTSSGKIQRQACKERYRHGSLSVLATTGRR
jgi:fatty-acyl-CoA synthase